MSRFIACILLLVSINALAEPTRMVIPNQNWVISFDSPLLTKQKEGVKPGQYMYLGNAGRFNLSLYVEDTSCEGGDKHEDYYQCFWPKSSRNPLIAKESVTYSCQEKYCKVEYDVIANFDGQQIHQRNINFLIAYHGKWTDLHVSIIQPTEEDQQMLVAFEKSLAYGEIP